MATAMKRLGVYLGLVDDEDMMDAGMADGTTGQPLSHSAVGHRGGATGSPVEAVPQHSYSAGASSYQAQPSGPVRVAAEQNVVDLAAPEARHSARVGVDPNTTIHTIHPRSYNDARRIGEEFRAGAPVIMNLTEMDDNDAKRIVDFAAGLVFAIHGSMERITKKVFLLSPANVDVRDAPAVRQARDGFFNQS